MGLHPVWNWDYRNQPWNWDYGSQIQPNLDFPSTINWDYGISPYLKLGLRDYAGFEIWITGSQDPPMGALVICLINWYDHWSDTLDPKAAVRFVSRSKDPCPRLLEIPDKKWLDFKLTWVHSRSSPHYRRPFCHPRALTWARALGTFKHDTTLAIIFRTLTQTQSGMTSYEQREFSRPGKTRNLQRKTSWEWWNRRSRRKHLVTSSISDLLKRVKRENLLFLWRRLTWNFY